MALGATAATSIVLSAVQSGGRFVGSLVNFLAQDGSSPYFPDVGDPAGDALRYDSALRKMGLSIGQCNAVVAAVAASPTNPWFQGMSTTQRLALLGAVVGKMQAALLTKTSGQSNTTNLLAIVFDGSTRAIEGGDLVAWLGANIL
jgi:hypothetical protein